MNRKPPWSIRALTAVTGAGGAVVQLVFLREGLALFSGSALVTAGTLSVWLGLTGAGAGLGALLVARWPAAGLLRAAAGALAVVPFLMLAGVRGLYAHLFTPGEVAESAVALMVLAAGLLPVCFCAGIAMAAAGALPRPGRTGAWALDALGDAFGGAVFALFLVRIADPFHVLAGAGAVILVAVAASGGGKKTCAAVAAAGAVLGGLLFTGADRATLSALWPGREITVRAAAPVGRLVMTEANGRHTIRLNGRPRSADGYAQRDQEAAHVPLSLVSAPARVLLIGGAGSGVAKEVLKHPVEDVVQVVADPLLVRMARRLGTPDDSRLSFHTGDGRRFLRGEGAPFDVILTLSPAPVTLAENRFFTRRFMQQVKARLAPGGVAIWTLPGAPAHISPPGARMYGAARTTAAGVFETVRLWPGVAVILAVSDGPLPFRPAPVEMEGAPYVGAGALDVTFSPHRVEALASAASEPAASNTDMRPRLMAAVRALQAQRLGGGNLLAGALAVFFFLPVLIWRDRPARMVAASGLAGGVLPVVWMTAFQMLSGRLYGWLAALVAVQMLGMALGASKRGKKGSRTALFLAAGLVLAAPAAVAGAVAIKGAALVALGLGGTLCGLAFAGAAGESRHPAGRLYLLDYGAAAAGGLVVTLWAAPELGLWGTAGLFAVLIVGLGMPTFKKKDRP